MGDVGSIYIASTAFALEGQEQEDGEALYEEELAGIRLVIEEDAEFMDFTDEDLENFANDVAEVFRDHLLEVLVNMRGDFIEGAELAVVFDMYENRTPDWEV